MFNPGQEYAGQTVLLTGGLGFLGSIVLEQLLRLTDVGPGHRLTGSTPPLTATTVLLHQLPSTLPVLHASDRTTSILSCWHPVDGPLTGQYMLQPAPRNHLQQCAVTAAILAAYRNASIARCFCESNLTSPKLVLMIVLHCRASAGRESVPAGAQQATVQRRAAG
jgi:hypothetical protein